MRTAIRRTARTGRCRPRGVRSRVEPIRIGDDCWICDGAVILAGTRLAPGCIVAANAVVRLTADAACVIAGNPATIVKRL